jgi:hypothetical protein
MSFNSVKGVGLASKTLKANTASPTTSWVRDSSWIALPTLLTSDNKFVGVHNVYADGGNYLALSAAGNYTVDWGDGTATENIASGVQANHLYDYTAAGLNNSNAPVILTDSGDVIGRTAHGKNNGDVVRFYNIASTTGLTEGYAYYVINAAADTFQVSLTVGGSAVALTTNGTATLLPYKQALVTVTMQGGQTFTNLNLHLKHTATGLNAYTSGFVDIAIAGASLTTCYIAGQTNGTTQVINFNNLERANIVASALTSVACDFYKCVNLQNIVDIAVSTSSNVNFNLTFNGCYNLKSIPLINTIKVTNFNGTFTGCYSLTSIPFLDTSAATDMSSMFQNCFSLKTIPLFNTSAVTAATSMFSSCYSLVSIPPLNLTACTNYTSMFASCRSLTSISLISMNTTGSSINCTSMFNGCAALITIPLLNTSKVTNVSSMFSGCSTLTSIPLLNTSLVTNFSSMFASCFELVTIPLLDTHTGTNFSMMFSACFSLKEVPALNTSAGLTFTSMFNSCVSLKTIPLLDTHAGTAFDTMFQTCSALETLPQLNTGAGLAFTAMFDSCYNLKEVPLLDTHSGTNFSSMFITCLALKTIPLLNTAAGTNFANMFNGDISLNSVPALNTAGGTSSSSFTNPFFGCTSLASAPLAGTKYTISYASLKLGKTALENIFTGLGLGTSQTITISGNYGAANPVAITGCNATGPTKVITMSNTTGINVGDQVTGTGTPITTGITAVTITSTTFTPQIGDYAFSNGDMISFMTSAPTGLSVDKIYYVVNAGQYSHGLSLTLGGTALTWTASGSTFTIRCICKVVSIVTNTSVTLDRSIGSYAVISSGTLTFRALNTSLALLKGWTLVG